MSFYIIQLPCFQLFFIIKLIDFNRVSSWRKSIKFECRNKLACKFLELFRFFLRNRVNDIVEFRLSPSMRVELTVFMNEIHNLSCDGYIKSNRVRILADFLNILTNTLLYTFILINYIINLKRNQRSFRYEILSIFKITLIR